MTFRSPRLRALILPLLLAIIGAAYGPRLASAAHPAGILLFSAAGHHDVTAGSVQKLFVHTMAHASVTLKVDYGNGQTITLNATTGDGGTHLFRWPVEYTGSKVVLARYWVHVARGSRTTAARGDFVLYPAAPLSVRVQVLTPSITSGDLLRLRIYSRPGIPLQLNVRGEHGHEVLAQTLPANRSGSWLVSAPISVTIAQTHTLHVTVTGERLGRQASAVQFFTVQPAPASQVSLLAGIPIPAARGASLDQTRQLARAAAGGSWTTAQSNARAATQAISADLDVLGQWTSQAPPHDKAYYQDLLAHATTYDELVEVTAQELTDDGPIEAMMRSVMPDKAIMVSLGEQVLRAYQNGQLVMSTYITSGRPELPTVTGHFHIYAKITPWEFISPWPVGSPYYYAPTWIKYWMPFYSGYGLHDAWWRAHYGPGTNIYGDGPGSSEPTGTHGCVNIPFDKTQWLWNWAPVGTDVVVYGGPSVTPGAAGI